MEGADLPEQRWPLLVCQEQEEGAAGLGHTAVDIVLRVSEVRLDVPGC